MKTLVNDWLQVLFPAHLTISLSKNKIFFKKKLYIVITLGYFEATILSGFNFIEKLVSRTIINI